MLALYILSYIALHLGMGGYCYSRIQAVGRAKCNNHRCDGDCAHSFLAGTSVIIWPITLPVLAGKVLGEKDSKKLPRAERKRQSEIEQKKHELELARIEAQTIRELEQEAGIR